MLATAAPAQEEGARWGYEGALGPAAWSALDPGFAACGSGRQQSPVDLGRARTAELERIKLDWDPAAAVVVRTDDALWIEFADGAFTALDDSRFRLDRLQLHRPAEHTLEGERSPLEVTFLHEGGGRALAIGVLVEEGEANPALQTMLAAIPTKPRRVALDRFTPLALLPRDQERYRYEGSLTTPPCSETVSWIVFATPVEASAQQLARLADLLPPNARPVQPLHRRFVLKNF